MSTGGRHLNNYRVQYDKLNKPTKIYPKFTFFYKNRTMQHLLHTLAQQLEGELHTDELLRRLYATDASIYRELPLAVAYPKHKADVQTLVRFAGENGLSLIPRSAGTSLAGQCVGSGIVVDISRYMTRVLEINAAEGWVRLQPGVIRDELNQLLKPHGLFFGPNTSTANRCMLGGMVGNNSCGTTSIVYGSTRGHVLALDVVLSDGSEARFSRLSKAEFEQKKNGAGLEAQLYRQVADTLADPENQAEIRREFPKPGIHRRNTGYAVDLLLETEPFTPGGPGFNFCTMLCGSEGTLAFTTEITLHVDPLPEPHDVVVCAHFSSMPECLEAVVAAMQHQPTACELMDKLILDCTKSNREQAKNRFFVEGDPAAVLMIEFRGPSPQAAEDKARAMIADLQKRGFGYAYPIVQAPKTKQVWELRSAGLGVLSNMPGEAKGVACIEDTAVEVTDLPAYIGEFEAMMQQFGQKSVYYAHAGAGELHLRPILNLKKESDREMLYRICEASARLVKKYRGSLSGEHGDGRVRAEFIPLMIGEKNYALLRQIKKTWDPNGVFNPGKITDAPPMNTALRYEANQPDRPFDTVLEFPDGILCRGAWGPSACLCAHIAFPIQDAVHELVAVALGLRAADAGRDMLAPFLSAATRGEVRACRPSTPPPQALSLRPLRWRLSSSSSPPRASTRASRCTARRLTGPRVCSRISRRTCAARKWRASSCRCARSCARSPSLRAKCDCCCG